MCEQHILRIRKCENLSWILMPFDKISPIWHFVLASWNKWLYRMAAPPFWTVILWLVLLCLCRPPTSTMAQEGNLCLGDTEYLDEDKSPVREYYICPQPGDPSDHIQCCDQGCCSWDDSGGHKPKDASHKNGGAALPWAVGDYVAAADVHPEALNNGLNWPPDGSKDLQKNHKLPDSSRESRDNALAADHVWKTTALMCVWMEECVSLSGLDKQLFLLEQSCVWYLRTMQHSTRYLGIVHE